LNFLGLHGFFGSGRVGTGPKQVGSSTSFFQIFLSASVLDLSVLTDHGSDGFEHGSSRNGSWPWVERVGSDPNELF
jgi:hypothetical protein